MTDGPRGLDPLNLENLGERVVRAARIAAVIHLSETASALAKNFRRPHAIGPTGPRPTDTPDGDLPASPHRAQ